MKVSIIIVSYNVKYFLDQCISSIHQSDFSHDYEIIVVDNASSDRSAEYIAGKYPDVRVIANPGNVGFSRANNIGANASDAEYLLILNPDTILRRDTLTSCLKFYENHSEAGIVGVKMYDGSGNFLPESKRGFPSPFVSFSKIFGLSGLFPSSRIFNRYYLGYLDNSRDHEVDVLTGAFMFLNKELYDEVGGFDEDYFMYGEDIDLSYKISAAGYRNYYLADTSIIHYKGESTRKLSFDYVKRFYEAMMIFARKHTSSSRVLAYSIAIRSAIFLNGTIRYLWNGLKSILLPIRDAAILGLTFYLTKEAWEEFYFGQSDYFSDIFLLRSISIYLLVSILTYLVLGKYHKTFSSWSNAKYLFYNLLVLLVVYSMLPTNYRFSRVVLVLGGVIGSGIIYAWDYIRDRQGSAAGMPLFKTAVVGRPENSDGLLALLDRRKQTEFCGYISVSDKDPDQTDLLGNLESIESIVRFHGIDEIIFDQRDIDISSIMKVMTTLDHTCQYKIYASESSSAVGSYSKELQGEIDTFEVEYEISSEYSRFIKRTVDVFLCAVLTLLFPVIWPVNKLRLRYWGCVKDVLFGNKTWVGYIPVENSTGDLPFLRHGVFHHLTANVSKLNDRQKTKLNFIYAREYRIVLDLRAFMLKINRI